MMRTPDPAAPTQAMVMNRNASRIASKGLFRRQAEQTQEESRIINPAAHMELWPVRL